MRILILDEHFKTEIARVRAHAEANHWNVRKAFECRRHPEQQPGNQTGHTALLPMGFKAVFTIDDIDGKTIRHLSVSVHAAQRFPHPAAVVEIALAFGFTGKLEDWGADTSDKISVQVMQLIPSEKP